MRRGTTPTIRITVDSDISELSIHLALKCGRMLLEKKGADLDVSTDSTGQAVKTIVECPLSQADTLGMSAGQKCEVQIRAIGANGAVALATNIGSIPVDRILQDGVLND